MTKKKLNPDCCIKYAQDEEGSIVDIVSNGNEHEAVAMAIHFLGKQCRLERLDLFECLAALTACANLKKEGRADDADHHADRAEAPSGADAED